MARVRLRRARPSDLAGCAAVFAESSADLARRQGQIPAPPDPRVIALRLGHLLGTDPAGFHVAARGARVVAFASTILRERVHFLSMAWALPEVQSGGLGRALVGRAFEQPGAPAGAARCVYASLDLRAQRLYLDLGMVPRTLIYVLGGAPHRLPPAPAERLELVPLGAPGHPSREALACAAAFDRTVRGCRRDADHRFELAQPGARLFAARHRGRRVGYVSMDGAGSIGPGAVTNERFAAPLAWAALAKAREAGIERVRMRIPGLNGAALSVAFAAGLGVQLIGAWMSDRPVGRLEGYLGTFGDLF